MRTKSAPDGTGLAQCDVFALPLAWHWMNCGLLSKRYLPEGPACATNVFSIRHNLLPIERCARVLLVDHLENLEVLQQHTDLRHCSFPILDHSVEKRLVFCCVGIPERVFSITKTGVGAKAIRETRLVAGHPHRQAKAQARQNTYCCHLLRMCVILLFVGPAYGLL